MLKHCGPRHHSLFVCMSCTGMMEGDFPRWGSKQARQELEEEFTSHGQERKEKDWQEAWPSASAVRKDVDAMEESHTKDFYYMAVCGYHPDACFAARVSEVLKLKSHWFHWPGKTVTIAALKRQPQARFKKHVCHAPWKFQLLKGYLGRFNLSEAELNFCINSNLCFSHGLRC